jgi:hypothetical protein
MGNGARFGDYLRFFLIEVEDFLTVEDDIVRIVLHGPCQEPGIPAQTRAEGPLARDLALGDFLGFQDELDVEIERHLDVKPDQMDE